MTTTFTARALTALAAIGLLVATAATPTHAASTAACLYTNTATTCYANETELDQAIAALSQSQPTGRMTAAPIVALAACASSVKLYTGTNYTGSVAAYTTRGQWINLGTGVDNTTSSFKIGACSASFAENAGGGGAIYPGSTAANVVSPSMSTGWDNRISSIWIN